MMGTIGHLAVALAGVEGLGLGEAAFMLADDRLAVFPCEPAGKRPLTRHGFHDATDDLDRVTDWWDRWPEANIGLPTGEASGVDVVDVDHRGHLSGTDIFRAARRAGVLPAPVVVVGTPSGGFHAYYPHVPDENQDQRSWVTAARIDFRSNGGYVIIPPICWPTSSGTATGLPRDLDQ
jgi:hypothetical protein